MTVDGAVGCIFTSGNLEDLGLSRHETVQPIPAMSRQASPYTAPKRGRWGRIRNSAVLIILLVISATVAVRWVTRVPHEPTYKGRALSEWLDASYRGGAGWWTGVEATDEAVRAIGTNGLPILLGRYCRFPNDFRQAHLETTIRAFHTLRPRARELIPLLTAAAKSNEPYRFAALTAIGHMGPAAEQAVPFLLERTLDTNAYTRHIAFHALGLIKRRPEVS